MIRGRCPGGVCREGIVGMEYDETKDSICISLFKFKSFNCLFNNEEGFIPEEVGCSI